MFPILFFAGPVGVRTAVLIAIAAVFVGAWLAARRLRQRDLPGALAYDFVTPALLSGLVAARLFYALAFDPQAMGTSVFLGALVLLLRGRAPRPEVGPAYSRISRT